MTGSISSKTTYLLVGRDGGESKLEKARDLKVKIISEDDLLQMIETRSGDGKTPKKPPVPTPQPPAPIPQPLTPPIMNDTPTTPKLSIDEPALMCMYSFRWIEIFLNRDFLGADKYKPRAIKNLIGQQGEKSCVQKLTVWLRDWYKHHGRSDEKIKAKPSTGFNRHEDPALFKAALLSGPPGIG